MKMHPTAKSNFTEKILQKKRHLMADAKGEKMLVQLQRKEPTTM
jgi:hypothetical protein